ncbi:MAG TPA: amino acid adenylation domain-containing protein [Candidatus Sulfotelmatobacter sp.]|jgi:amino acid adenylation domain-containing protein
MTLKAAEQIARSSTKESPLSPAQERLWVLDQLHPRNPAQNIAGGMRFTEGVDRSALESALRLVVQRHEILRTVFRSVDGEPRQMVLPTSPVQLRVVDLRSSPAPERPVHLLHLAQEEVRDPFDLAEEIPWRATLFGVSDNEHVLLVVTHRIVCDEISMDLLRREIALLYLAQADGKTPQQSSISPQCNEIISRQTVSTSDLSYWLQRLQGAPSSLDLPTDRARPPVQTFGGAKHSIRIEAALLRKLLDLAQEADVTLFSTVLAALGVLLFRYSRQHDIVIGTRVSGREQPELKNLIGPLENMLALRVDLSGDPTFSELLIHARDTVQQAFDHQDVPFETLLRELRLERDMSRHPLFQVMLTLKDVAANSDLPAVMSPFDVENSAEQLDLSVELTVSDDLQISFSYNPDLFDAATIGRMAGHLRILLESAANERSLNDASTRISQMPLLSEAERHQLLVEWNDTRVGYPRDVPLHRFIEDQVEKTPESIALVFGSERLSYSQLNGRANQLAHRLKKYGVGPDVLVGVCAERSLELVIALLAVIKAGGAYIPLDPEYPKDRLETMLQDANPPVVLTQAHLLDRLPDGARNVFGLDRDWPSLQSESPENIPSEVNGKSLAYAIYTSGSTGKPKGVPNVHEGIVNRLLWMQEMYRLTARDRVLQKTPFSFDVSVWEFFWPLMTGATLVVARPGGHRDPAYLVNLIADQGITTLHFVPSMLNIFLEVGGLERCQGLRQVFASGEALPFELQQRFFERLGAELHNLYGPTEAAVDVTYWRCTPDSERTIVPIGRPIANTQIYILDTTLQPVPIGVAGELHIGGIGLARGYLNKPDLTAQKFIPDPFNHSSEGRLYKTGDLARFLSDGNVEYLGRIDHQVKLRGFRIELGEIEAVLGECTGVLQATVVVREDNPGDRRLVAYLIPAPGQEFDLERVRKEVKDKLPEYMVPSRFVVVQEFPMTTSGKVDRKALPPPALERETSVEIVAPRNELESKLAGMFANVLGLPSVGVTDNFFDLGGHSLLAGRLLSQVNEKTGRQIPLSALFRGATVESLALLIEQESEGENDPVVMEIQRGESSRLPFFAIVPPGEESLGYAMLARHMGPEQTVYKIQGQTPVTRGKRPYSADEMRALTREYIAAMRSVQPHGPYCVGGLCDGTHIAEQIVLSLEAQGEELGLFAIFDTWVLQHSQRRWLWKIYYYGERLREVKKKSLSQRVASYKRVAANKVQNLVGAKSSRTDWQQAYWPEDFTPPRFRAPVILFKRPNQPFYYIDDPQMGWGARSAGGVEIHKVDFHHAEILREPQVGIFGLELAAALARVSAAAKSAETPEASLAMASPRQPRS